MNFPFRNVQYNQKKCSMFGLVILKTYVPTATHVEGTRDLPALIIGLKNVWYGCWPVARS